MIAATSSSKRIHLRTARTVPALHLNSSCKATSSPSSIITGLDEANALSPLIQATLTSASAYHALSEVSRDRDLSQFAVSLLGQRYFICQELHRRKSKSCQSKHCVESIENNEFVSPIRKAWLNSLQSLNRNHSAGFIEHAENAEWLLEEAFLTAINTLDNPMLVSELREHAIAICDARQCWAEFACIQLHIDA